MFGIATLRSFFTAIKASCKRLAKSFVIAPAALPGDKSAGS
jgi:hypothetical protein